MSNVDTTIVSLFGKLFLIPISQSISMPPRDITQSNGWLVGILLHVPEIGPQKYQQIWCCIKMYSKQSSLVYVSSCYIVCLLLLKDRNNIHKIVLMI